MPSPTSASTRCAVLLVLGAMVLSSAAGQTRVNGVVPACAAIAPADVVAEVRTGLAWFPFEVGRGTVGADGAFALRFHEQPNLPVELTATAMHLFDGLRCEQVTISDHAARIVVVRDLRVIPRGAPCEYCETLGRLYAATRTQGSLAATGDHAVVWIHTDRFVALEGFCTYGWGQETYALTLQPGWNTVVLETVAVHPTEGYCDCRDVEVTVAPFPTSAVTWHFVPTR